MAVDLDKIAAALAAIRTAHVKLGDQITTLEAVLADQPTPTMIAKGLIAVFVTSWSRHYRGEKYTMGDGWVKHAEGFKRVLKTIPPGEVERRIEAYLRSPDPFYGKAHHDLGLFISAINKFGTRGRGLIDDIEAPVVDCRHQPRCASDQQHTKRRTQEARA